MMSMLLDNKKVIQWCFKGVTDETLATNTSVEALKPYKAEEKVWANEVMGTIDAKQWTTKLCENLVQEALVQLGRKNVRPTINQKGAMNTKAYSPDLECDDFIYEVKGRSWCTTGTAGEKILGVPLKYAEVPKVYRKPLRIVLVGYQEWEARNGFAFGDMLDESNRIPELSRAIEFHKDHEIEYVGFTDMLKELGLGKEYWDDIKK